MSIKLEHYKKQGYLPTIGIECHVQLKTKTKLFAGVANDARDAMPNTLISHICLGMPGALPVLNEKAIELAIKAAFALQTTPQVYSKFDRKHYFYPDLPKGYQITQFEEPIILGGKVSIEVESNLRDIAITRAHLEEDAGKSSHPSGKDYSLVDLNRAGTPLLEIVSEPEMHSSSEAKAYARELYLLMRYSGVSEADLYHGNMRFDVNVSVSKDKSLGIRTETKNLNSFKSVEKAVEYEIVRQIEQLEKGYPILQETRGWDEAKQKTFTQRSKEESHDYRYFPEPDLPPIILDKKMVDDIKKSMPVLPSQIRGKLQKLDLDQSTVNLLVEQTKAGNFMYDLINQVNNLSAKRIANWLSSEVQAMVTDSQLSWDTAILDIGNFMLLDKLVNDNQVSSTGAKAVLQILVKEGGDPLVIAKERDLLQVSDEDQLNIIIKSVIKDNQKAVKELKAGQEKVMGFLVGQVMKLSKGKANPSAAQQLIKKALDL